MGQAAAEGSDLVVLTSDNPRSEDPLAIMNDALVGIRRVDVPHMVEPDRATAIARALKEAREGDIVILAGKGHETYQVLKDRTIPFDDRAVAREVLQRLRVPAREDRASWDERQRAGPTAMTLDLQELRAPWGPRACDPPAIRVAGWSVDTRTQTPGDVYFALRGDRTTTATIMWPPRWRKERGRGGGGVEQSGRDAGQALLRGRADTLPALQDAGRVGAGQAVGRDGGGGDGQRGQDHHQGRHRAPAFGRSCRWARPSAISTTTWACRSRFCDCRTIAARRCSKWE